MSRFSLTERQRNTLDAVARRIVPADETPDAAVSGAAGFIERLLNEELSLEQGFFVKALEGIEQEAGRRHNLPFCALTLDQQDTLLSDVECQRIKGSWEVPPGAFFKVIVELVLEGFYADPGNGGNLGSASWKMLGYRPEEGSW